MVHEKLKNDLEKDLKLIILPDHFNHRNLQPLTSQKWYFQWLQFFFATFIFYKQFAENVQIKLQEQN